jgi:UDP-glucose 4-epimerase
MIGIYGANGFIGRHIVRRLSERNLAVRAVSRKFVQTFTNSLAEQVEFVEADLRQPLDMIRGIHYLFRSRFNV